MCNPVNQRRFTACEAEVVLRGPDKIRAGIDVELAHAA
jgi:hypothetical protein